MKVNNFINILPRTPTIPGSAAESGKLFIYNLNSNQALICQLQKYKPSNLGQSEIKIDIWWFNENNHCQLSSYCIYPSANEFNFVISSSRQHFASLFTLLSVNLKRIKQFINHLHHQTQWEQQNNKLRITDSLYILAPFVKRHLGFWISSIPRRWLLIWWQLPNNQ